MSLWIKAGGITKSSELIIDSGLDLSGGDYDITMKAGRTVDGLDLDTHITDKYVRKCVASDVLQKSDDSEVSGWHNTTYGLKKELTVPAGLSGELRIKFAIRRIDGGQAINGKLYRNGVAVGTEQGASDSYVVKTEDIAGWSAGDLIQLYCKSGQATFTKGAIKDFRVYCSNYAVDKEW